MNLPKPSQNPSLSQSAQGIALTSITPSTKSQQPLAYHLLNDEESSTQTTSLASSQQIPNQEAPTRLPANQNIINNPNQPLTISPDLTELKYHELHLAGHQGWRSPVKGIISLLVLMIFVVPFILLTLFEIYYAFTGESENRLFESNGITPAQLLYMNLALASLIPISYFLNYRFHGLSPGWMNSVERRIRWCWLFVCFGLSIGSIIAAGIVVSMFIPVEQNNTDTTQATQDTQYTENTQTEPNGSLSSTAIQYAIIVLFLTPLQAAGEEFAFRGYLTQAFSALFSKRWRWMGILIPAILFAMAHGFDQTFPMVFDRFLFGIVTGVLVILTGGLEAGIAMHVVNNVLIFTVAVAADSLDQTMETGSAMESQWWIIMVVGILKWAIYVVLILLLAPSHYLQTKVWKAVVRGEILPIQGVPVFTGMPHQMASNY